MTRAMIIEAARSFRQNGQEVVSVAIGGGWHLVDFNFPHDPDPVLVGYDEHAFDAAHSFRRYLKHIEE